MLTARRRLYRRAVTALAVIAFSSGAVSCGDSTSPGSLAGTYTLQTVNGSPLPFITFQDANFTERITGATLTLASNSTYTISISYQETDQTGTTTFTSTGSGTFALSGSTITFDEGDADAVSGTVSGKTITVTVDGDVWVLRKP